MRRAWLGFLALGSLLLVPATARAAQTVRFSTELNGDVAVIGNTLGWDCGAGATPPAGTTVTCTGALEADGAPDLYWRDGAASPSVAAADARTTATLTLPSGATVAYARLFWGALRANEAPDRAVTLDREGVFTAAIDADDSRAVPATGPLVGVSYVAYQSTADVTDLVRLRGSGVYRVTGVDAIALNGVLSENAFSAWTLVVVYSAPAAPSRSVVLYDGLDPINTSTSSSTTISGLSFPPGSTALGTLAVWAFDGEAATTGDRLRVKGQALSDALNPADNLFNSSRTERGSAVAGAAPPVSGQPGTMAGFDLDVFDLGAILVPGDTSVVVAASTTNDDLLFGGFVLSTGVDTPPVTDAGSPDGSSSLDSAAGDTGGEGSGTGGAGGSGAGGAGVGGTSGAGGAGGSAGGTGGSGAGGNSGSGVGGTDAASADTSAPPDAVGPGDDGPNGFGGSGGGASGNGGTGGAGGNSGSGAGGNSGSGVGGTDASATDAPTGAQIDAGGGALDATTDRSLASTDGAPVSDGSLEATNAGPDDSIIAEGSGCRCTAAGAHRRPRPPAPLLLALPIGALWWLRRRAPGSKRRRP